MVMSCSPEFLLHRAETLRSSLSGQSQNRVPRAFPPCGLAGESWDGGAGMEVLGWRHHRDRHGQHGPAEPHGGSPWDMGALLCEQGWQRRWHVFDFFHNKCVTAEKKALGRG